MDRKKREGNRKNILTIIVICIGIAGIVGAYFYFSGGGPIIGGENKALKPTKSFPFKNAYLRYNVGGFMALAGKFTGKEILEVTNVTEDEYTVHFTPKGDLKAFMNSDTKTFPLGVPIHFSENQWENFTLIGKVSKETELGKMKLSHYLYEHKTEEGTENVDIYLENETRIPLITKRESGGSPNLRKRYSPTWKSSQSLPSNLISLNVGETPYFSRTNSTSFSFSRRPEPDGCFNFLPRVQLGDFLSNSFPFPPPPVMPATSPDLSHQLLRAC
ncbi:hypothetical protein AKJ62_01950 [candidate division MSBL1 archaeon SCGC-AAA259D14]|uniref:Uncharacterized protein n=1 Tax=candidate division MSBL1 archaeon SCGC-AAA259D14 TaxID=1698261 RepID=A0A133U753_9EURY|nr:hypothetical protein AKJ62_01950 [candidate division MSBL1 archaeon SCGC-AAA259D14]